MYKDKLIQYQSNLEGEIVDIFTIANITDEEKSYVYEINYNILEDLIQEKDENRFKKIISNHIEDLNIRDFDTEFREFIVSSLHKTAEVVDVNVSFLFNKKLYGLPLASIITLFKLIPPKITSKI